MYWLNVQELRVKVFVVCCVLIVVCCVLLCFRTRVRETSEKVLGACLFVGLFVCAEIKVQQHFGDITGDMGKSS